MNVTTRTLSEIELFKEWLASTVAEYDRVGNVLCEYTAVDLLEPCFDNIELSYDIGSGMEGISEELSLVRDNLATALANVEFAMESFDDFKSARLDLPEQPDMLRDKEAYKRWEKLALAAEDNPRYLPAENSTSAALAELSNRKEIYAGLPDGQLVTRLIDLERQYLEKAGEFSDFER